MKRLLLLISLIFLACDARALSICDSADGDCAREKVGTNVSLSTRSGIAGESSAGDEATVPIGTIIAWPGPFTPGSEKWKEYKLGKWLECDGSDIKKEKYPKLWAMFDDHKTPDLTGRFLRGLDPKDSKHGVLQRVEDTIQSHDSLADEHTHQYDGWMVNRAVTMNEGDVKNKKADIATEIKEAKAAGIDVKNISLPFTDDSVVKKQTYEVRQKNSGWNDGYSSHILLSPTDTRYHDGNVLAYQSTEISAEPGFAENDLVRADGTSELGYYKYVQCKAKCWVHYTNNESKCGCKYGSDKYETVCDEYAKDENGHATDTCVKSHQRYLGWSCDRGNDCDKKDGTTRYWGPEGDGYADDSNKTGCDRPKKQHCKEWQSKGYIHREGYDPALYMANPMRESNIGPKQLGGKATFSGRTQTKIEGSSRDDVKFGKIAVEGSSSGKIGKGKLQFSGGGNINNDKIDGRLEYSSELTARYGDPANPGETAPEHTYVRYFIRARN